MNDFDGELLKKPARESWLSRFQVVALALIHAAGDPLSCLHSAPDPEHPVSGAASAADGLLWPHAPQPGVASLLFGAFVGLPRRFARTHDTTPRHERHRQDIGRLLRGFGQPLVSMSRNVFIRFILSFFFYFFNAFFFWVMQPERCWDS